MFASRYIIQNRYQDSGWSDMKGEAFASKRKALARAKELCKDAIVVGMTRVIDTETLEILKEFPAGG